jgi:hypothetical protein
MLSRFVQIMLFYIVLSYLVFPVGAYYIFGHNLQIAGMGYVVGSLISVVLWLTYGRYLV